MGIDGGVVGGMPPNSKAPISRILTERTPRWSVVVGIAPPAVLLALMAILPATRAKVWVNPPLFARVVLITVLAPPVGVMGVMPVNKPPSMPLMLFVPTMFAPVKLSDALLKISFPNDALFPTMILLLIVAEPPVVRMAPPVDIAELLAKVLLPIETMPSL